MLFPRMYQMYIFHWLFFNVLGLDVPMDLTVTSSTDNTITLVWGVVQGPIDFYKVTYTSSSGVSTEVKDVYIFIIKYSSFIVWTCVSLFQLTVPKEVTSTTVMDLEPGTEYTITVAAQRGRQQSNAATIDAYTGRIETHKVKETKWEKNETLSIKDKN